MDYHLRSLAHLPSIIILILFITVNISAASTLTVSQDGSADFTSIQEAYYNAKDGDTILVYPGTYNEDFTSLREPLTDLTFKGVSYPNIIGEFNIDGTVIWGKKIVEGFNFSGSLDVINGGDFTIDNNKFNHCSVGNFGTPGDYIIISNNEFNSSEIYISDDISALIENNTFFSCYNAIKTEYPGHVNVKNNIFSKNHAGIFSTMDLGLFSIENNTFLENDVGLSIEGFSDSSINKVKNNNFTNNKKAIALTEGRDEIIGNRFEMNDIGIDFGNSQYFVGTIYNNYFYNNINIAGNLENFCVWNIDKTEGINIVRGPYLGGNFWGKPDDTGFSQTCPDADLDGFCDEPYILNNYNVDFLPLKENASPIKPILPKANFSINMTEGYAPLTVQFIDLADNATGWNWDFGDETASIEQSPMHTYSAAGTYTVNLTVSNANGTDSKIATINVLKSIPTITWNNPADIVYGIALSNTQLDASASVLGSFVYTPPLGTVLSIGIHTLHVDFIPTDTVNYTAASKDVTINVLVPPPTINSITVPLDPVPVNTSITVSANVTYLGDLNSLAAEWNWGDGSISNSQVSSNFETSHVYNSAGIYTVTFTVKDNNGGIYTQQSPNCVVVYDPQGGFVTGGGWINSPAGAYLPDNSLEGKATFGFVSKYQKSTTVPTGKTEFQFKVANLNFQSENYDWLVIAGSQAKYKGTGTINGEGNYGFMLYAVDGAIKGDNIDKFRIKIWDKENENTIYDNEIGTEDPEPQTIISGGSIIIHKEK